MMQLTFLNSMNKKILALILGVLLVAGFIIFRENPEEPEEPVVNQREEVVENDDELREIITGYIGTPYKLGPLDESDNIYRDDVFDCTTFVLVTVSNFQSSNPEEEIKNVNYHPAGEVSYENRLHFSTYRNKVNDYFKDITADISEDKLRQKEVALNQDRLIDIDWQEEITIDYVKTADVSAVTHNLPEVAGVMFMRDGNADIGLDINHEGFVLDGQDLVHASPTHGQVYRENFLEYLERSDYDGVGFYKIN